MNVAVVLPELDPRSGGGFTFQQTLFDALKEVESDTEHRFVYYWRGRGGGEFVRFRRSKPALLARRSGELVRELQDHVLRTRPLDWQGWFDRSLRKRGIDLVWFSTGNGVVACDQPYILTVWDVEYLNQPWFPEVGASGEWERRHAFHSRFVPQATRVIVPGEAGKEQVLRYFPLPPERLLPLHHPTPQFALEPPPPDPVDVRAKYGLHERYLFYPAQFWAHKNHATLLHALAELNRSGNGFELVCVGSDKGELQHVRRLLDTLGAPGRVHLLGFVDTPELVALYREAHALVYPSFFGPQNLPPLEAFGLGCPVVAADVPGVSEHLGVGALLVPPTDAAGFAHAVEQLEDRDLRTRLVEAGRRRAEELSAASYVRGVLDFLDEFEPIRRCWE